MQVSPDKIAAIIYAKDNFKELCENMESEKIFVLAVSTNLPLETVRKIWEEDE